MWCIFYKIATTSKLLWLPRCPLGPGRCYQASRALLVTIKPQVHFTLDSSFIRDPTGWTVCLSVSLLLFISLSLSLSLPWWGKRDLDWQEDGRQRGCGNNNGRKWLHISPEQHGTRRTRPAKHLITSPITAHHHHHHHHRRDKHATQTKPHMLLLPVSTVSLLFFLLLFLNQTSMIGHLLFNK